MYYIQYRLHLRLSDFLCVITFARGTMKYATVRYDTTKVESGTLTSNVDTRRLATYISIHCSAIHTRPFLTHIYWNNMYEICLK